MTDNTEQKAPRKPRGFAAMGPEFQREIAAQGGRAAHRLGKAHRFNSQEARAAAAKRHAARNEQNGAEAAENAKAEGNAGVPGPAAPEEAEEQEDR
ncbi:hypothetical protein CAL29_20170 [Bordetella genomosp. 10]|uniref:Stress-induced protein n=1 Tax=Bordetella genomosp. 10 TaxID=1416804 RepID=A0A261RZ43_9BORD|nr:KGG domain-containing protein [Bordetella genomosp. 10]OZI30356.1 hypothetical protein CAL29_20170 [Bordetella genomosp. 10]